jgi:hypothetical protein
MRFMRHLSQVTKAQNLTTVILNSVITTRFSFQPHSSLSAHDNPVPTLTQYPDYITPEWNYPSIFMSNTIRPALGQSFTHTLDFHMLLSSLPRRDVDARILYGGQNRGGNGPKADMANMIEVLGDRYGNREGQYAAFKIEKDVGLYGIT